MNIKVAGRFRPYSHLPGAACLIPGQAKVIHAWPSQTLITTLEGTPLEEGPGVETLFQDLERPFSMERLSFGIHKSQDVDLIRRRADLAEILPIWFKLATFYRDEGEVCPGSLLYELLHETDRNKLGDLFLKTYLSGFTPFFLPRSHDSDRHGFTLPPLQGENPLLLLTQGAKAIKRMIVQEEDHTLFILPCLPSLFSAGRFIDTRVTSGLLSVEWTKHFLRQVHFTPDDPQGEMNFRFPKEVKGYRVNFKGNRLIFDNFKA